MVSLEQELSRKGKAGVESSARLFRQAKTLGERQQKVLVYSVCPHSCVQSSFCTALIELDCKEKTARSNFLRRQRFYSTLHQPLDVQHEAVAVFDPSPRRQSEPPDVGRRIHGRDEAENADIVSFGYPWCGGAIRRWSGPGYGEGGSGTVRHAFLRRLFILSGGQRTRVVVGGGSGGSDGRGGRGRAGKRHEPLEEIETQGDPDSLAESVVWLLPLNTAAGRVDDKNKWQERAE